MKKWIFAIIVIVVIQQWSVLTAEPLSQNNSVELYATQWCKYCKKARNLLDKHNVKYVEYDIEKSKENFDKYKRIGGRGIPVLVINGNVINGYNADKILNLLSES